MFAQPITNIVNSSPSDCTFPDAFKHAVITPLIKKPSLPQDQLQNFRRISNLSFISKVLERVVFKQLNQHIMDNNQRNPCQKISREWFQQVMHVLCIGA